MAESSLSKTARALDLIPYVMEHQGISVSELAEKFQVTDGQILEDLNLLFCCGLPGYTPLELIDMQFEDGIVTVSDPQKFDKPRKLLRNEIISILVALEILEGIPSHLESGEIANLKRKLSPLLDIPEAPIVIPGNKGPWLEDIVKAIESKIALEIEYVSAHSDAKSKRKISPMRIISSGEYFYLLAWCASSNAERTFRTDRILSIQKLSAGDFTIMNLRSNDLSKKSEYRLRVDLNSQRFIEENRNLITEISRSDEYFDLILVDVPEDWLLRTARTYLGGVKILAPESTAQAFQERLKGTLARYD